MNPFTMAMLLLIRGYQIIISPFLRHRCRFFPSCSAYAHTAFTNSGFFIGMYLTIKRLLKCQPFHEGGFDPVPICKKK
jgi:putative membrane protein insertion efficiency factor